MHSDLQPWQEFFPMEVLDRLGDQPAVLVSIVDTKGSTPRATGSWMVVTLHQQYNTIGGGHLEFQAIERAHTLLCQPVHADQTVMEEQITLGASLGQCCGGVVILRYERLPADPSQALSCFGVLPDALPTVAVMGAGHVGAAIVALLSTLPISVVWADRREAIFPSTVSPRVSLECTDDPAATVGVLTPQTRLLVMTHSHADDFDIIAAALKRRRGNPDCLPWVGLIGSATKWASFRTRLEHRGFAPEECQAVRCPIGIPDITTKLPAGIAVSVVAQVLADLEQHYPLSFAGKVARQ